MSRESVAWVTTNPSSRKRLPQLVLALDPALAHNPENGGMTLDFHSAR